MNEINSFMTMIRERELQGTFMRNVSLNKFIVFNQVITTRNKIAFAVSEEMSSIVILNLHS